MSCEDSTSSVSAGYRTKEGQSLNEACNNVCSNNLGGALFTLLNGYMDMYVIYVTERARLPAILDCETVTVECIVNKYGRKDFTCNALNTVLIWPCTVILISTTA